MFYQDSVGQLIKRFGNLIAPEARSPPDQESVIERLGDRVEELEGAMEELRMEDGKKVVSKREWERRRVQVSEMPITAEEHMKKARALLYEGEGEYLSAEIADFSNDGPYFGVIRTP
jgi:hypothetical protein